MDILKGSCRYMAAVPALAIAVTALAGGNGGGEPGLPSERGIQPVVVEGNPTCGELTNNPDVIELKVDPGISGFYTDGDLEVTIEVNVGALGPTFDWKSKGGQIHTVFSKGGPRGNLYDYENSGWDWDNILHSPTNPNGKYAGLSHISFCYVPGEPSVAVEKTCLDQTADLQGSTTTNEINIVNDGDFVLTELFVTELIAGQQCVIVASNNAPANTALPAHVRTAVPNVGNVAVNQVVPMTIKCFYPDAANVPNEIKADGNYLGTIVEDVDSSNPNEECRIDPDPMVDIRKDCERTRLQSEYNQNGEQVLVAEACSKIIVENTGAGAFFNVLDTVIVTDPNIPALANGVDVGPLLPGEFVNVQQFLGLPNLCWKPVAPVQPQNNDPDGVKYDTVGASFKNTAGVTATAVGGKYIAEDDATAICPLCPPCEDDDECEDDLPPIIKLP